jgi:hypothetical protein
MPKSSLKLVFTAACLGIGWDALAPQAWPSQKKDKSVPGLQVVRTWGELLDQPVISLADGNKVRLGVEAKQVARGSAILIYALLDGNQWSVKGEQPLGPLRVQFHRVGVVQREASVKRGPAARVPRWDNAKRLLFATTLEPSAYWDIEKARAIWPEKFRLAVLAADNALVAEEIIAATSNRQHPWLVFGSPAKPKTWRSPEEEAVRAYFGMSRLHPATPFCDGSTPILEDGGDIPRERPLPGWTFAEPDPRLSLRADARSLRIDSKTSLYLSWPGDRFLHRLWVNGRPFVPEERIEAYGIARSGRMVFGTRLDVEWEFEPARIKARKGDRVGVQVLYCPGGWRFHDDKAGQIGTHGAGDSSLRLPRLSNRVEFTVE